MQASFLCVFLTFTFALSVQKALNLQMITNLINLLMKKLFTFCVAVAMGSLMAYAQDDVCHDYEFVTAEGTVIPDGSSIVISRIEKEEDPETGEEMVMVVADFTVKNVSGNNDALVRIVNNITRIDNGSYNTCAMGLCIPGKTEPGEFYTSHASIPQGSTAGDLQTEWYPDAYGKCIVELQLEIGEKYGFNDFEFIDFGPKITAVFDYPDPSGVKEVQEGMAVSETAHFTLDGARTSASQKGVHVVRYSDGKVRKVIVR